VGHKSLISFVFTFIRRTNLLEFFFRARATIKILFITQFSEEKKTQNQRAKEKHYNYLHFEMIFIRLAGEWTEHSRIIIKAVNLTVKKATTEMKKKTQQISDIRI
jgi:hypothetical protein